MKKIYIIMAVLATVALASCQQEKSFDDGKKVGKNEIVFTFRNGSTRSAEQSATVRQGVVIPIESEADGVKMVLEETVVNLNDLMSEPATKGTPAYTENVGVLYANNLNVVGDKGVSTTAATFASMDEEMVGGGWRYQHNYDSDPFAEGEVGFYLNMPAAPKGVTITDRANGKFTFDYTSPTAAVDQEDIIFAYRTLTKEQHKGYLPNGAPVLFNHALTAVKFAIGNSQDEIDAGTAKINSVTFKGLKNTATGIVMAPVMANDDGEDYTDNISKYTSAKTVSWATATADPADNTISSGIYSGITTYEKNSAGSFGEGKGNYPASFSNGGNENNLGGSDGSQVFWLIPQDFDSNSPVQLTINYTYGDKTSEWTIDFGKALAGVNWQAGELRTYTIKINDVNVRIEDVVTINGDETNGYTGSVKDQITITNTGNTKAFIRAAIVGQWLDAEGNPVFGFSDKINQLYIVERWYEDQFSPAGNHNHGEFVGLAGYDQINPYRGWTLCKDGYYYYTTAVDPTAQTEALFDTYTVKERPKAEMSGSEQIRKDMYFSLEIATQAISAMKLDGSEYTWEEAWENASGVKPEK